MTTDASDELALAVRLARDTQQLGIDDQLLDDILTAVVVGTDGDSIERNIMKAIDRAISRENSGSGRESD